MKLKILLKYIRKLKPLHPIDDSEMMNNAIKGMIDNDEYSAFLDKQLFAKFEKLKGNRRE